MTGLIKTPCNKNSQQCVGNVMSFLADISGDKIVTGQHTQTMGMEELHHIREVTGREPALLGFELLSYTPNINYLDTDEECMTEVKNNLGTIRRAWEWTDKKGLVTFTWHWFSPLGGHSKSFFTENTDFDAEKAVISGTAENRALLSDMDTMAGILRPFCEKKIPILWRPFHEADGDWFWWGSKGHETGRDLYIKMYHFFVDELHLNHLLWVWNSPAPEGYPGDEYVDVISRDVYLTPGTKTDYKKEYEELIQITDAPKVAALGEVGLIPDMEIWEKSKVPWAYFMTWSKEFCMTEEYNTKEDFKKNYASPYMITRQK